MEPAMLSHYEGVVITLCFPRRFLSPWWVRERYHVTVMRRSRSRVGGLVLLHFIRHLLPELHHGYVM
jgi:hypothetical protein